MKRLVQILAIGGSVLLSGLLSAGPIDTFEDGTTQGWVAGGGPLGQVPPVPPHNVPTGGPGGAGDAYLEIQSFGGGAGGNPVPGSRLTAFNIFGQWAGNYLTNGIAQIEMDLNNLGQTDLVILLEFESPFQATMDEAVTNTGIALPAGSGWTHAVFPIGLTELTALEGTVAGALGNTTVLRIIHAPGLTDSVPIAGLLGVDNIAAAIPEPATIVITAAGLTFLLARMKFCRR